MFDRISQGIDVYKQTMRRRNDVVRRFRQLPEEHTTSGGLVLASSEYAHGLETRRIELDLELDAMARALGLSQDEVRGIEREIEEGSTALQEHCSGIYGFCG